jgi:anti-anti-sigma factor
MGVGDDISVSQTVTGGEDRGNGRQLKWPLRITAGVEAGAGVVTAAGRVANASAGKLDAAIRDVAERARGVVVDLSAVDYMSSAGVEVVRNASRRITEAGGVLVLTGVGEPVRIALDLAGILPEVRIAASRADAVRLCIAVIGDW